MFFRQPFALLVTKKLLIPEPHQPPDNMPKVITGKCGHRCEHFYIRSRVEGDSKFRPSNYVYCPVCKKVYPKEEVEYERRMRLAVKGPKHRRTFVVNVPGKIRMLRKPNRKGEHEYSEEEFDKLKSQIERNVGIQLKEVEVYINPLPIGFVSEYRLVPADTPVKSGGSGYDMTIEEYEEIERKMQRKVARAGFK